MRTGFGQDCTSGAAGYDGPSTSGVLRKGDIVREYLAANRPLCGPMTAAPLAMSLEDTGSLAPAGTGAGLPLDAGDRMDFA